MIDDRSLERAARSWLEEGPIQAPDRAVDAALSRIQTTSQERDLRIPWRLPTMFTNRLTVAAAALVLVVVGAGYALSRVSTNPGSSPAPTPTTNPTVATTPAAPSPTTSAAAWHGQILVEHLGNAPDGSEHATDSPPLHRFYLVDPNNMTKTGYTEFLPGQPSSGKASADVSRDGKQVVFQDWTEQSSIYIANIDGTGFRKLTATDCGCQEWDPAFDPTGTKIVYGHGEAGKAWLEILDLATNTRAKVAGTTGSWADNVVEAPSWSPDGTKIVFARTTWNGQASFMGLVHYDESQDPLGASLTILTLADGATTTLATGSAPMNTIVPGDPFFSPDGSKILFLDHPFSKMPLGPFHGAYTINLDGTDLRQVIPFADGANWTPDGKWILATYNYFTLNKPDGSPGGGLVDKNGTDNTEDPVGYIYNGYWVGTP